MGGLEQELLGFTFASSCQRNMNARTYVYWVHQTKIDGDPEYLRNERIHVLDQETVRQTKSMFYRTNDYALCIEMAPVSFDLDELVFLLVDGDRVKQKAIMKLMEADHKRRDNHRLWREEIVRGIKGEVFSRDQRDFRC